MWAFHAGTRQSSLPLRRLDLYVVHSHRQGPTTPLPHTFTPSHVRSPGLFSIHPTHPSPADHSHDSGSHPRVHRRPPLTRPHTAFTHVSQLTFAINHMCRYPFSEDIFYFFFSSSRPFLLIIILFRM